MPERYDVLQSLLIPKYLSLFCATLCSMYGHQNSSICRGIINTLHLHMPPAQPTLPISPTNPADQPNQSRRSAQPTLPISPTKPADQPNLPCRSAQPIPPISPTNPADQPNQSRRSAQPTLPISPTNHADQSNLPCQSAQPTPPISPTYPADQPNLPRRPAVCDHWLRRGRHLPSRPVMRSSAGSSIPSARVPDTAPADMLGIIPKHWYNFPPVSPLWHYMLGMVYVVLCE